MSDQNPTPAAESTATSVSAPPEAGESKPRRARRASTMIDSAIGVARAHPSARQGLLNLLVSKDPGATAAAELRHVEFECAARLADARARRDFARHVQDLDAVGRAMVRAGLEQIAAESRNPA